VLRYTVIVFDLLPHSTSHGESGKDTLSQTRYVTFRVFLQSRDGILGPTVNSGLDTAAGSSPYSDPVKRRTNTLTRPARLRHDHVFPFAFPSATPGVLSLVQFTTNGSKYVRTCCADKVAPRIAAKFFLSNYNSVIVQTRHATNRQLFGLLGQSSSGWKHLVLYSLSCGTAYWQSSIGRTGAASVRLWATA